MKKIPQDIIGNIAVLKFPRYSFWPIKKIMAWRFLKNNPSIKTVLDKKEGFSGDLRIPKLKYIAGEKNFEAVYRENDCIFRFDLRDTYFSGRLSNDRKLIAEEVLKIGRKKNFNILVLFSGVGPYPIVIGKILKKNGVKAKIVSVELNSKACEYGRRNVVDNKLSEYISIINSDVMELSEKIKEKFEVILMMRPNLKETFLGSALNFSKKGTLLFYHGFGTEESVIGEIKKDSKNKSKEIVLRKCGDIGAYRYRYTARFKVN